MNPKPKLLLCLALVLSGGLFGCATKPEPINYLENYLTNHNFENYLANCGTNQIRCVWFENDLPNGKPANLVWIFQFMYLPAANGNSK